MKRFNHQSGDLEGIVNYGLSIEGIKMAVLFSERDGIIKISFRSKGEYSVKDLAENILKVVDIRMQQEGNLTLHWMKQSRNLKLF